MFERTLLESVLALSQMFPVVMVTGPRQVGKSTLLQTCASDQSVPRRYVTLDDLNARDLAVNDPALFLQQWPAPVIIDEIQYAPGLLSAIKVEVDRHKRPGMYWLTGSQKFALMKGITESLAGRVGLLDLLGLSQAEIHGRGAASKPFVSGVLSALEADRLAPPILSNDSKPSRQATLQSVYEQIWLGSFPQLNELGSQARDAFYRSYVQTYIERDVQDVLRVTDHITFNRFLGIVASNTGQLLSYATLARDLGVDNKTIKSWLSVLETSGLVYLLQPYFSNLNKRIVKAPKLYFLDTGLAAYLTRWPDPESLQSGNLSGAIFETWVVSEVLKSYWHNGKEAPLYYYRDSDGREIDLLIESGDTLYPIEIKRTATPTRQAYKQFHVIETLGKHQGHGAVVCLIESPLRLTESVTAVPAMRL
ncbi:MAG TPA: ATP-binding protein [Orrella sp.]